MTSAFLYHGGRLHEAIQQFGGDPASWLDLSTGLNPTPWPISQLSLTDWACLPDPDALTALEYTAARHFNSDPELTCAVPGSETALRLIAQLLNLPGRAFTPSYRTHAEAFSQSTPITFGQVPKDAQAIILANPNNPDGVLHPASDVRDWHQAIAKTGGWLIVDEAFGDCHANISIAPDVTDDVRLIVMRSFGKFFGLAGLRLGFIIAPRAIITPFRALLGSWPLHTAAISAGLAAYADSEWIAQTRVILPLRAKAVDRVLRRHGLSPHGACSLFRYIIDCDAPALFKHLTQSQILTRPFAANPTCLRMGVPASPVELDRLDRALAQYG